MQESRGGVGRAVREERELGLRTDRIGDKFSFPVVGQEQWDEGGCGCLQTSLLFTLPHTIQYSLATFILGCTPHCGTTLISRPLTTRRTPPPARPHAPPSRPSASRAPVSSSSRTSSRRTPTPPSPSSSRPSPTRRRRSRMRLLPPSRPSSRS